MRPAPSRMLYDFWPWPGVDLLNDTRWPDGVAWKNGTLVRRPDGVVVPVEPREQAQHWEGRGRP